MATEKKETKKEPVIAKPVAPEGFRKLKSSKSVCFGNRTFSGKKDKNSLVPETVIKMLKLDEKRGDKPALSDDLFI